MAAHALELDVQLMLRVRQGDQRSFDLLLAKHRLGVIHYLFRMVQNQAVAEDLAQEVFLRVYRARTNYEPSAKFTTWLFRIATHLALNHLRDDRWRKRTGSLDWDETGTLVGQIPDLSPTAEQNLVSGVRVETIRDAIRGLPAKQRAAVIMHKYHDMDYVQIAGVLGCTEAAVKSLLFRAYERLRARLGHLVFTRGEVEEQRPVSS